MKRLNFKDEQLLEETVQCLVKHLMLQLPYDEKLSFTSRFLGLVEDYIYDEEDKR